MASPSVRKLANRVWTAIRTSSLGKKGLFGVISLGLVIIFRNKLEGALVASFDFLLRTWVYEPIGKVGLIAVAVFLVWAMVWFAGIATKLYREAITSPTPPPEQGPPKLSAEERLVIDQARVLWKDCGKAATGWAFSLLFDIQQSIGLKQRLGQLLRHPNEELRVAMENVEFAIHDRANVPLAHVIDRLEVVLRAYMEVTRWIHECWRLVPEDDRQTFADRSENWITKHRQYLAKMTELSQRADYASLAYVMSAESRTLRERFPPLGSDTEEPPSTKGSS
jgi:hypothetical protein